MQILVDFSNKFCYAFDVDLLTVKDVAEKLKISVWRVHQLIREKRLPAEKLGSQYVIKEKDLKLVKDRPTGRPPKDKNEK